MDVTVNGEQVPVTEGTPMVSPELAAELMAAHKEGRAAWAAVDKLREIITEILAEFGQHYCEDPDCESYVRIPTARLARWRERAGLEG